MSSFIKRQMGKTRKINNYKYNKKMKKKCNKSKKN